jgi:uridine phosphorylase
MHREYPILEFDDTGQEAIIEPSRVLKPLDRMPEHVILCFFQEAINQACAGSEPITNLISEIGKFPVFVVESEGRRVAVAHPGVGAPLAAGFVEELIALGGKKFIACGGAGVLDKNLFAGHLVVPISAVRDEGTSYHYLPPSREVSPSPEAVEAIEATLKAHHMTYVKGKTWTTDALYRETPAKIARRKAEDCITVEMEAAAFFAVAQFRGMTFGQILYSGDDVSGAEWDSRDWIHGRKSTREKLFWLSIEAVLRL